MRILAQVTVYGYWGPWLMKVAGPVAAAPLAPNQAPAAAAPIKGRATAACWTDKTPRESALRLASMLALFLAP